jgi:hypothetical protein
MLSTFYVNTGGSTSVGLGDCRQQELPCGTISAGITASQSRGTIAIMGASFTNGNSSNPGNVEIPAGSALVFTTSGTGKISLIYGGNSTPFPFFTVTTGDVTFVNLTIMFSSANTGVFLLLQGFIIFAFNFFI